MTLSYQRKNISKKIDNVKKRTKRKNAITEMKKICQRSSTVDLNWQKKELATFKINEQKLLNLKNREKTECEQIKRASEKYGTALNMSSYLVQEGEEKEREKGTEKMLKEIMTEMSPNTF